jgi:hypothetical protein
MQILFLHCSRCYVLAEFLGGESGVIKGSQKEIGPNSVSEVSALIHHQNIPRAPRSRVRVEAIIDGEMYTIV